MSLIHKLLRLSPPPWQEPRTLRFNEGDSKAIARLKPRLSRRGEPIPENRTQLYQDKETGQYWIRIVATASVGAEVEVYSPIDTTTGNLYQHDPTLMEQRVSEGEHWGR